MHRPLRPRPTHIARTQSNWAPSATSWRNYPAGWTACKGAIPRSSPTSKSIARRPSGFSATPRSSTPKPTSRMRSRCSITASPAPTNWSTVRLPGRNRSGRLVRAYRSAVDGSVQPYALDHSGIVSRRPGAPRPGSARPRRYAQRGQLHRRARIRHARAAHTGFHPARSLRPRQQRLPLGRRGGRLRSPGGREEALRHRSGADRAPRILHGRRRRLAHRPAPSLRLGGDGGRRRLHRNQDLRQAQRYPALSGEAAAHLRRGRLLGSTYSTWLWSATAAKSIRSCRARPTSARS